MVYLLESRTHLTLERLEIIGHYTDIMQGKELYFAFASNLSERKMKERGAKFTSRESAVLRGYRFVFNTNCRRVAEVFQRVFVCD